MSFDQVGKAIGRDEVWTAALFYGQVRSFRRRLAPHPPTPRVTLDVATAMAAKEGGSLTRSMCMQAKGTRDDLDKLSATLDVPRETLERAMGAAYFPERSLGDIPPRDPLLYRLYESAFRFRCSPRLPS